MAVSKVTLNGETLIDITSTTANSSTILNGYGCFGPDGVWIDGEATGGGSVSQDSNGYIVLPDQGGGSSITVDALSVTANGTYTAATGHAYSPVTVNVSGSGDSWSWMGKNPEKLDEFKQLVPFSELNLDNWTWSTTAATLKASEETGASFSVDCSLYDYFIVTKSFSHHVYSVENQANGITDCAYCGAYALCKTIYPDYASYMRAKRYAYIYGSNTASKHWYAYRNASGIEKVCENNYYGIDSNGGFIASINDRVELTGTAMIKSPAIRAQGHSTYFSQNAFNNLDVSASYIVRQAEVWRVESGSSTIGTVITGAIDCLVDGLVTS